MKKSKAMGSTDKFEKALKDSGDQRYVLRLYVKGQTPNSRRAMKNAEKICSEHLQGRYELEIIDLNEHPELAKQVADIRQLLIT